MNEPIPVGTHVIPLPPELGWRSVLPGYLEEMECISGQVGIVVDSKEYYPEYKVQKEANGWVYVSFDHLHEKWWYLPTWLRVATPEEVRGHAFALTVKKIG